MVRSDCATATLRPLAPILRPVPPLVLSLALALAACAPVPPVSEFTPRGGETAVMAPISGKAAFWTAFADPQLDALMQAGLTRNLTLREAARFTVARKT